MAQKTNTYYSNSNVYAENEDYVYGNTALRSEAWRELENQPQKRLSNQTRRNREKALYMNFGYVLFLFAALFTSAVILINYINLQSELTNQTRTISSMESELNTLRVSNDEAYTRVNSKIDLDEIRDIAINKLGMVYATEGQIVVYSDKGNDYMRSVINE